jgi:hypothetical protein
MRTTNTTAAAAAAAAADDDQQYDYISLSDAISKSTVVPRPKAGAHLLNWASWRMPFLFKNDANDSVICEGDLAVVVMSHRSMCTITVTRDQVLSNKNGFFPHNSFIGQPWGLKVYSEGSDGFVRIIRPTAELWTLTLPHRTQVIYQPDISLAIMLLALSPGKTVAGIICPHRANQRMRLLLPPTRLTPAFLRIRNGQW